MAEMWYYTNEGKQMEPVSIKELKRLVTDGVLKPTDMVWKEGMARWIRASSLQELYPDPIASLDHLFSAPKTDNATASATAAPIASTASYPDLSKPEGDDTRPRAKKRRREDDDDTGNARRRPQSAGGSSFGIIVALLLGGGLLLVGLVVGVVILIVATRPGDQDPKPPVAAIQPPNPNGGNPNPNPNAKINPANLIKGVMTYNANVGPGAIHNRMVSFRKGAVYEITVRSEPRHPDVDLYVWHRNGQSAVDPDITEGPDSFIRWSPREDDEYRIEIKNLDPFANVTAAVTIREMQAPPNLVKKEDPPVPPDVKTGRAIVPINELAPGQDHVFKLLVKAKHAASVRVTMPLKKKSDGDIRLFIVKDRDDVQIVEGVRQGLNVVANFNLPATEVVRVRVQNSSKATTFRCTVVCDGGQ